MAAQFDPPMATSAQPRRAPARLNTAGSPAGGLATSVEITAEAPPVALLATFAAICASGQRRVAGLQVVDTAVDMAFDRVLPLRWMASVLIRGNIAPNRIFHPYSGVGDQFALTPVQGVTMQYANGVWQIPHFDGTQYAVEVGFGLGDTLLTWAYATSCSPGSSIAMAAGAYQLCSADGSEAIGDPVPATATTWAMNLGDQYRLAFDASGNATLSQVMSTR